MTNEKAAVPREVAEAIEELRKGGRSNFNVMKHAEGAVVSPGPLTIRRWAFDGEGGSPSLLMQALVIGYEVEKTPEEKALEEFRSHAEIVSFYNDKALSKPEREQERFSSGYVAGAINMLDIHGIKIESVNA